LANGRDVWYVALLSGFWFQFAIQVEWHVPEIDNNEFTSPQREAAFFFGLFLRGHSVEELRQDIDVPRKIAARWERTYEELEPGFRDTARRVYEYRKQVLAIFNFLVSSESTNQHKM
jgi:hypothetical protein